eukprot:1159502-Pelagomonas_calceolata.AAC.11
MDKGLHEALQPEFLTDQALEITHLLVCLAMKSSQIGNEVCVCNERSQIGNQVSPMRHTHQV